MSSSSKTKKMATTLLDNYGNCTTFKLCNENEEFYRVNHHNDHGIGHGPADRDYRNLLMLSTPPSKSNHNNKYLMLNSNHQGASALFSCTPKDETAKIQKEDMRPTTMFNSINNNTLS